MITFSDLMLAMLFTLLCGILIGYGVKTSETIDALEDLISDMKKDFPKT